jgi:hypothetical protein
VILCLRLVKIYCGRCFTYFDAEEQRTVKYKAKHCCNDVRIENFVPYLSLSFKLQLRQVPNFKFKRQSKPLLLLCLYVLLSESRSLNFSYVNCFKGIKIFVFRGIARESEEMRS